MRRKKNYVFKTDAYYFTVKSSPKDITMYRNTKEAATDIFKHYSSVGKKLVWLGKWNGKKFEEVTTPTF